MQRAMLIAGFVLFTPLHAVFAAEGYITAFDARATLHEDASVEVIERIRYDFGTEERHGIFRKIPYSYQAGETTYTANVSVLSVSDENGKPYPFAESRGTGALDALGVERIDHGVRCVEDPALVRRLARERIPLTVCPLSNVRLRVFETLAGHNLPALLAAGLCATVNSDDPAYFGGYISRNFRGTFAALPSLTARDAWQLAANSFEASFAVPRTSGTGATPWMPHSPRPAPESKASRS